MNDTDTIQNAFADYYRAALPRVMNTVLKDDTQLFKMYWDNESFRRQLSDLVFRLTYERPADAP